MTYCTHKPTAARVLVCHLLWLFYAGFIWPFAVFAESVHVNFYAVTNAGGLRTNIQALSPYGKMAAYLYAGFTNASFTNLHIIPSVGSHDILVSLENDSGNALAIVQADALHHYFNADHPLFSSVKGDSQIKAVAKLFPEWIFIAPKASTRLDTTGFSAFLQQCLTNSIPIDSNGVALPGLERDLTADCGDFGSGSLITALNIKRVLSLSANFEPTPIAGNADFRIRVISPGNNVANTTNLFFTAAEAELLQGSLKNLYRIVPLRGPGAHGLTNLPGNAAVVCVDAVLVTTRSISEEVINTAIKLLGDLDWMAAKSNGVQETEIAKAVLDGTAYRDILPTNSLIEGQIRYRMTNLPIALHRVARVHNSDAVTNLLVKLVSLKFLMLFFGSLLAISGVIRFYQIGWEMNDALAYIRANARRFLILAACFLGIHVGLWMAIWLSEYHFESEVDNPLVQVPFWVSVKYLVEIIQKGDASIKINSALGGVCLAVLKAGYAASSALLVHYFIQRHYYKGRFVTMKDADIIIGENNETATIEAEIQAQHRTFFRVRLDPDASKTFASEKSKQVRNLFWPVDELGARLQSEFAHKARSIIILHDEKGAKKHGLDNGDVWSLKLLRIVVTSLDEALNRQKKEMGALESSHGRVRRPRVVVELSDPELCPIAKRVGADDPISIKQLAARMITHSATKPEASELLNRLLSTRERNFEMYTYRATDQIVGKSLKDIAAAVLSITDPKMTIVLLGIHRSPGEFYLHAGLA